jgi:predicted amidohydrolase
MKIALCQISPIYGDSKANIDKIIKNIENIAADIIVFPELATSGYFFVNKAQSIRYAKELLDYGFEEIISEKARKLGKIICYGYPELANDKIYNSAKIIFPNSNYNMNYRKTHLFYKERFAFDEGDTGFNVVNYPEGDISIGLMICYDWRFPESARALALQGADIIICPSNLVTSIWTKVMPARAIENKVFLAVANRVGIEEENDERLVFNGLSGLYSYSGDIIVEADAVSETIIVGEFEPRETRDKSFNSINNIFNDRRTDKYSKLH